MFKRIAMLALLCVSLIGAKTYDFSVADPTQAGGTQLKAGAYSLKVEGSQVQLMDQAGHRIDVAAKVEEADRKFDQTVVSTSNSDGVKRLLTVGLGGTKTRVVFQ